MIIRRDDEISKRELELMGNPDFEGTIIDIETYGPFERFSGLDGRKYRRIRPTVFGAFNGEKITQLYLVTDNFDKMRDPILEVLTDLSRPYYAFNALFEMGVLLNFLGEEVMFEYDIQHPQAGYFEKKERVFRDLQQRNGHIQHKDLFYDPYRGDGSKAMKEWARFIHTGDERLMNRVVAHNRACLLKEWYILSHRRAIPAKKLNRN